MRNFVNKTLVFVVIIPFIYIVIYKSFDLYFNSKESSNSLFIWGDSQAYQGIDLNVLKKKTNRNVYTAARHGAGVYDFLVFAEKVPENSDVIVAISKPAQLRRKDKDRNSSGISLFALRSLLINNYSWIEILEIIRKNIKPVELFLTETKMYDYQDSITLNEPIELFRDIYSSSPSYLNDKQNLYIEGIRKLKSKECRIYLIDLPHHELLKRIESRSHLKSQTDSFSIRIRTEANCMKLEHFYLKLDKQVMYDLTHLNCIGAEQVANFIGERVLNRECTTFLIHN